MGRTTFSGPVSGAYVTFTTSIKALANGATDDRIGAMLIPFACRVVEISFSTRSVTAAAGLASFRAKKNAVVASAGTNLLSADGTTIARDADFAATPTSSPSLSTTAGVRDLAKGDTVVFGATGDATVGNRDVFVSMTVRATGHCVAASAND